MARNGNRNSQEPYGDGRPVPKPLGGKPNALKWLSPYLDAQDQVWLQDNANDLPRFVLETLSVIPAGYTVSSKFDDRTDRWLTTIICDRVDDPNRGIAVTGRGSTRINSLYTALYIGAVKLEWVWLEAAGQNLGDFG